MHVVSRFLRIFMRAEKQAYKQLQCNKAKLLEPASINGLHNSRVYRLYSYKFISYALHENVGGYINTVTRPNNEPCCALSFERGPGRSSGSQHIFTILTPENLSGDN